jgi:DNA-binding PadR family transcriptional regulator
MLHAHGLDYALLGLISRSEQGIHGYALKRQFERIWGACWRLSFGEVYRALNRLVGERLIQAVSDAECSHRKSYRITDAGCQKLSTFVEAPPTDAPHPFRRELAVKLVLAGPEGQCKLLPVLDRLRDAYAKEIRFLGVHRRRLISRVVYGPAATLALDGAELCTRAELAWIDRLSQELAKAAAPSGPMSPRPSAPETVASEGILPERREKSSPPAATF